MSSHASNRRRFFQSAAAISGLLCLPVMAQEQATMKLRFAIALHGGAGKSPTDQTAAVETSLAKALDKGVAVLEKNGTSLDAVEQVIRFLEDDLGLEIVIGAESQPEEDHAPLLTLGQGFQVCPSVVLVVAGVAGEGEPTFDHCVS